MKIQFVGTGGAFDFEKGTAAAVVTLGKKTILVDCGFSTLATLVEKDIISNIDHILITHLHGDHIGSLPTLLPYVQHKLGKQPPSIIVPNEHFKNEINEFLTTVYEDKRAVYLPITDVPEIGYLDTSDQHIKGMTSFAYYFVEDGNLIYYSGDIGNAQTAADFLQNRTEQNITVFHETTPSTDIPVHAAYTEVQELLGNYDTYVYHIAKENMPSDCNLRYVEDYPELIL